MEDFLDYLQSGQIRNVRRSFEGFVITLKSGTFLESSDIRDLIKQALIKIKENECC